LEARDARRVQWGFGSLVIHDHHVGHQSSYNMERDYN
jgi:hypothetical protein